MVYLFFFLRYRAQLRRTRPELVSGLEDAFFKAVEAAGGKISGDRRLIGASFDEDSLGFWLNILLLIENVLEAAGASADDLHGYALVLCRNMPDAEPEALCRFLTKTELCRFLTKTEWEGGVFFDQAVQKKLLPYIEVQGLEAPERKAGRSRKHSFNRGGFFRLTGLRKFALSEKDSFPLRETIIRAVKQGREPAGQWRNTLALGPAWAGMRDGLLRFCEGLCGDFPPLLVRCGAGGINALTGAWTAELRTLAESAGAGAVNELDELREFLFKERLRDEQPVFTLKKAARFFSLLLDVYAALAGQKKRVPVIILEDIHRADKTTTDLFINSYTGMKKPGGWLTLGTCDERVSEDRLREWKPVFPRLIKTGAESAKQPHPPGLPPDLLETAYALSLFSLFFPPELVPELLAEEGKAAKMIFRALSLLHALGVIDTLRDPQPWAANFIEYAEAALGEKKERVRLLVRSRLLAWVGRGKLSPCFRLLVILAGLGGAETVSDQLILKSIISDLANGTAAGIERAADSGLLETLCGNSAAAGSRAAAVRFIIKTSRVLLSGGEAEIRAAFRNPPPDCAAFPALKAQVLVNLSSCHLGIKDNAPALETVKEALLLSQGKNNFCLAQSYRLFALVNLSRQQTGETIEYLNFAVESAGNSGNRHELSVSSYYAASAQFLFGNLSRSEQLARKARDQALAAGLGEWADRSRFLEGRLAFELGRYQKALKIFEALRTSPSGRNSPEKDRLMAAWAYRSRVYFQNPLCGKPENGGHDADLFEVEAAYLSGNYRRTIELASVLVNLHTEENFLYTEQPDWRSGFAQCELLFFSHGEHWERMRCVFNSLALCRISASGGEEAVHNMQGILRNEQLPEMDPWDAFYFYAWYCILEQSGAGRVDMNTAISIAFKRLQRRAGRIDDIETRREYLSQPRWNSALNLASKKFKLL